jgi:signal peptidase II
MIIGIFISLFAIAGLVALDLYIKDWAVTVLEPVKSVDFIKIGNTDILGLYYTENTGAAFSFFENYPQILTVIISVLLIAVAIYGIADKNKHPLKTACLVMILAGGLGNLIDRIRNGYVIDYLEFRFMNFAIFNFADILVTCGALVLIVFIWVMESNSKNNTKRFRFSRKGKLHNELKKYKSHNNYDR